MNYPFEFKELLLTSYVLDKLGFTTYHDGAGDFGTRKLDLGKTPHYEITEIDAKEDVYDGYGYMCNEPPHICSGYYMNGDRLYFLHDMYDDILLDYTIEELNNFIEKCKEAKCYPYIESYLKYKNK